jgi:hypothetical protein
MLYCVVVVVLLLSRYIITTTTTTTTTTTRQKRREKETDVFWSLLYIFPTDTQHTHTDWASCVCVSPHSHTKRTVMMGYLEVPFLSINCYEEKKKNLLSVSFFFLVVYLPGRCSSVNEIISSLISFQSARLSLYILS